MPSEFTSYTRPSDWNSANWNSKDRKQSTTPTTAFNGLPNQRPVTIFGARPGLYDFTKSNYSSAAAASAKPANQTFTEAELAYAASKGTGNNEALQTLIQFCGQWDKADCSAFDDPLFAKYCGLCLTKGNADADSEGPTESVFAAGQYFNTAEHTVMKKPNGTYYDPPKPTYGQCSRGGFVVDKERCLARKRQLFCEGKGKYKDPDCAVCSSDGSSKYVPAVGNPNKAVLRLYGHGPVVVQLQGAEKPMFRGILDTVGGILIPLTGIAEGTVVHIRVGAPGIVGGLLMGPTAAGTYSADISKLVFVDMISGSAPRREGYIGIREHADGPVAAYVYRMVAAGNSGLVLPLRIPYEFLGKEGSGSDSCNSGPVLRTAKSAEQIGFNACSGEHSFPGNYSLECLQYIWTINGCSAAGKGYPRDIKQAAELLWDYDSGKAQSLQQIHKYVREMAGVARIGRRADGSKAGQGDITWAQRKCFGRVKTLEAVETTAGGPAQSWSTPPAVEWPSLRKLVDGAAAWFADWMGPEKN
jgi:hypothetical protein